MTFNLSYITNDELPLKRVDGEATRFERIDLSGNKEGFLKLLGGERGATIDVEGDVLFRIDGKHPNEGHVLGDRDTLSINNSDNLKKFKAIAKNDHAVLRVTYYGELANKISPDDIRYLSLWLDTTKIEGKDDGDFIDVWEDASGKGNDAIQEDIQKRLRYRENYLNGNAALTLNTEGEWWMEVPGDDVSRLFADKDGRFTVFIVSRVSRGQSGTLLAKTSTDKDENNIPMRQFQIYYDRSGGASTPGIHLRYSPNNLTSYDLDNGEVQVMGISWDGKEGKFYSERGVKDLEIGDQGEVENQHLYIGTRDAGGSTMRGGALGEIIVYSRALEETEIEGVYRYLNEKWVK